MKYLVSSLQINLVSAGEPVHGREGMDVKNLSIDELQACKKLVAKALAKRMRALAIEPAYCNIEKRSLLDD